MSNLAISYARFSSLNQSEGDSLRRQAEAAAAYAEANGLVIDQARSFRDLGVSAYDQSNIRKGALGLFLEAVEAKKIPIGSTLIVESFDRLSRATPLDALSVFTQIINAGLNLVILTSPPKKFSRESIKDNVFQLMEALLDMYRAHAESQRKSQLVTSAWQDKKKRAIADGSLMSARAPHWIDVEVSPDHDKKHRDKRKAKLNAERAAIVLKIVEMAERGTGNTTIIRSLHADGVTAWSNSGKWEPSYVQKILKNVALYGAIDLDGEIKPGYYPAVITEERFHLLQALRSNRATTKNTNRKGKLVTNLFSGKLKCGYCSSSMNIAGYKSLATGYERKYVACHGARIGATECSMKMWFIDELEPALLFWITSVDYSKLVGSGARTNIDQEREQLAMFDSQLKDVRRRITSIEDAIEDGATSMIPRLKEREADVIRLVKLIDAQEKKVNALASQEGGGASRMKAMVLLFKALKRSTDEVELRVLREQLSAGIAATIKSIVLFPAGRSRFGTKDERFAVVTFENGASRTLDPDQLNVT